MVVQRLDDWDKRLSAYLASRKNMPFEWGMNDCLAFVAKGVEEVTGIDFYQHFNDYHDEETANVMLGNNGGAEGIINKCLGHISHRNVLQAKRGDVVIAKLPDITAGLVDDSGCFMVSVHKNGLIKIPLKRVWRVWSY